LESKKQFSEINKVTQIIMAAPDVLYLQEQINTTLAYGTQSLVWKMLTLNQMERLLISGPTKLAAL
jgi:hypothetical protein